MFATGESVGLAEWIIDDTCLVFYSSDSFFTIYLSCCILKADQSALNKIRVDEK